MKKFLNFALLYLVMFAVIIGLFVAFCITAEWKWLLGSWGFAVIIMSELFLRLYRTLKESEMAINFYRACETLGQSDGKTN